MNKKVLMEAVVKMQKGDELAFNEIYNETNQSLFIYAKYLMKDKTAAEDLLQDTYIEIFKSIKNLKNPEAFLSWSKSIMYHLAQHVFAGDAQEFTVQDESAAAMFDEIKDEDREFSPEESVDLEEVNAIVQQVIEKLPVQQRMAMLSYYFDDMSVKDISAYMGVSEGTVKTRLYHGRLAVKGQLEDYEEKHDIRLHALAPFPLILSSLKSLPTQAGYMLEGTSNASIFASVLKAVGAGAKAATATGSAGVGSAGGSAAAGATGAASGINGKIIAIIVAAVLVLGGGGFGAYKALSHDDTQTANNEKPKAEEQQKDKEREEKQEEEEQVQAFELTNTYTTRFSEANAITYPDFRIQYSDNWTLSDEMVDNSHEAFTLTSKNGAQVKFYHISSNGSYEIDSEGMVTLSKADDSNFVPGYVQDSDYSSLGRFGVMKIQRKGNKSDEECMYAVLPQSRAGNDEYNHQPEIQFSFEYSGHISVIAYPPANGNFSKQDLAETLAILKSFQVVEQ